MMNVTLVGDQALMARLQSMPNEVRQELVRKVTVLTLKLELRVKRKLSGEVLHVRSHALRNSIARFVETSGTDVTGMVASTGHLPYAAIHEFGGKIPPHVIEPRKAKVLAFMVGGKQVFARRVQHPGATMPERSYLRSSLRDMRTEITVGLNEAVITGMQRK